METRRGHDDAMRSYRPEIEEAARAAGISADLVEAVVRVESAGDPWAWNPEPRYRYLWDVRKKRPFRALTPAERASEVPPPDFGVLVGDRDQEWWAQQASWGLMQIMGAVAREQGFSGPYLPAICEAAVNLAIGAKVLLGLLLWANDDLAKAVAAYNAGRGGWRSTTGQDYAAKVLHTLRRLTDVERAGESLK